MRIRENIDESIFRIGNFIYFGIYQDDILVFLGVDVLINAISFIETNSTIRNILNKFTPNISQQSIKSDIISIPKIHPFNTISTNPIYFQKYSFSILLYYHKIIIIQKPKQYLIMLTSPRVQFFQTNSSILSPSVLSSTRLQQDNQQIVSDTQNIFVTLNRKLIPRQDINNKKQLDHIIHLAKILLKQTIPEHQAHLLKNNPSSKCYNISQNCANKLQKLITHFENYTKSELSYEQFFKLYGPEKNNFKKQKSSARETQLLQIKPDIVNVVQNNQLPKTNTVYFSSKLENDKTICMEKNILQLNNEIIALKRRQKQLKIKHQHQQLSLKTQTQHRITNLLNIFHLQNQQKIIPILKKQLLNNQSLLQIQLQKNKQLLYQLKTLSKQLQQLQSENQILKNQISKYRKIKKNSQFDQLLPSKQQNIKSVYSQINPNQNKNALNLIYQINLLKNQLTNQRQNTYKMKQSKQNQQQTKIRQLNQTITNKNNQLETIKMQLDKQIVNNLKLNYKLQTNLKQQQLKKLSPNKVQSIRSYNTINVKNHLYANEQNSPLRSKYQLETFTGDDNQYYPYFDLMNKQFIIRFKKGCFKEKELLYKANGLQIGMISQFIYPNQLKFHLFLSNFSDQQALTNITLKSTNSKNNKIQLLKTSIQSISIGQQFKTSLNISINSYPLGYTSLLCQYQYYGQNQQVRILIPAHIFKMLVIKQRDDQFRQSTKIQFPTEKKIVKQFSVLCTYFKGANTQTNNTIHSTIIHEHTQTKLLCDITLLNKLSIIEYQHRSGQPNLTQYIIKSLTFLLKKSQNQ